MPGLDILPYEQLAGRASPSRPAMNRGGSPSWRCRAGKRAQTALASNHAHPNATLSHASYTINTIRYCLFVRLPRGCGADFFWRAAWVPGLESSSSTARLPEGRLSSLGPGSRIAHPQEAVMQRRRAWSALRLDAHGCLNPRWPFCCVLATKTVTWALRPAGPGPKVGAPRAPAQP